ncbi:hypothetical protein BC828DRAFT_379658 [Blastocladiella britannica]|nr:hypothetical protein BC828DRAFT_379658 [Blastocladiella britannica]
MMVRRVAAVSAPLMTRVRGLSSAVAPPGTSARGHPTSLVPHSLAATSARTSLPPTLANVLESMPVGTPVTVHGWVRSARGQKGLAFVHLADGTNVDGVQVVVDGAVSGLATGTAVRVSGTLVASPPGLKQAIEVHAVPSGVEVLGACESSYPLQKKRHGIDFLRTHLNLRPRSALYAATLRVRAAVDHAIHAHMRDAGFLHVHTPILTASDCEGAGETFTVHPPPSSSSSSSTSAPKEVTAAEYFKTGDPTAAVSLTVSGQLHLEMFAAAHPRVYTVSPAFRAEQSVSSRHLSEFAMVEAEIAWTRSLDDVMGVTAGMVAAAAAAVDPRDVECIARIMHAQPVQPRKGTVVQQQLTVAEAVSAATARVESLASGTPPPAVVPYTEAVAFLSGRARAAKFTVPVQWGMSLQAEHEHYLADDLGRPVFVVDYPKSIKPFYMLPSGGADADQATVQCFDLLAPGGAGELAGGSLREHRADVLEAEMVARGMDPASYAWYLDLRRYGCGPHGGFGLGLDRLVRYLAGVSSVRDVVPVPRMFGECQY